MNRNRLSVSQHQHNQEFWNAKKIEAERSAERAATNLQRLSECRAGQLVLPLEAEIIPFPERRRPDDAA